jgi:hypothetical protein
VLASSAAGGRDALTQTVKQRPGSAVLEPDLHLPRPEAQLPRQRHLLLLRAAGEQRSSTSVATKQSILEQQQ